MDGLDGQLYDTWQIKENIPHTRGGYDIDIAKDPDFDFVNIKPHKK